MAVAGGGFWRKRLSSNVWKDTEELTRQGSGEKILVRGVAYSKALRWDNV